MAKKQTPANEMPEKLRRAKRELRTNISRYLDRKFHGIPDKRMALANASGVGRTTINRYLSNKETGPDHGHATIDNLIRIAEAFGISVKDLLENVHDTPTPPKTPVPQAGGGKRQEVDRVAEPDPELPQTPPRPLIHEPA